MQTETYHCILTAVVPLNKDKLILGHSSWESKQSLQRAVSVGPSAVQDILASWSSTFKTRYSNQPGAHYYELSFVESAVCCLTLHDL